jgi:hypothetical protein
VTQYITFSFPFSLLLPFHASRCFVYLRPSLYYPPSSLLSQIHILISTAFDSSHHVALRSLSHLWASPLPDRFTGSCLPPFHHQISVSIHLISSFLHYSRCRIFFPDSIIHSGHFSIFFRSATGLSTRGVRARPIGHLHLNLRRFSSLNFCSQTYSFSICSPSRLLSAVNLSLVPLCSLLLGKHQV